MDYFQGIVNYLSRTSFKNENKILSLDDTHIGQIKASLKRNT